MKKIIFEFLDEGVNDQLHAIRQAGCVRLTSTVMFNVCYNQSEMREILPPPMLEALKVLNYIVRTAMQDSSDSLHLEDELYISTELHTVFTAANMYFLQRSHNPRFGFMGLLYLILITGSSYVHTILTHCVADPSPITEIAMQWLKEMYLDPVETTSKANQDEECLVDRSRGFALTPILAIDPSPSLGDYSLLQPQNLSSAESELEASDESSVQSRTGGREVGLGTFVRTEDDCVTSRVKKPQIRSSLVLPQNLKSICVDLGTVAKGEKIVGRDKELTQISAILGRHIKNNPLLIGEAGVGKTAIVEALARQFVEAAPDDQFYDWHILSVDFMSLIISTKFKGEFEARLQALIKFAESAACKIVLFLDELHVLHSISGNESSSGALNLLKPALARNQLSVIGATTNAEYQRYLRKDGAFARRFQEVQIPEPTPALAVTMIQATIPTYSQHHVMTISNETITHAVNLSKKYIMNRYLPDKALDLLDYGAACKRRELGTGCQGILETGDIDKALQVLLGMEYDLVDELPRLRNLTQNMLKHILGQDEAIAEIVRIIRQNRLGLSGADKPWGNFLLTGPTGVGKTEVAIVLAKELFGSRDAVVRLNMSEFSEQHSVAKLLGSPPGYIGYDDQNGLLLEVSKHPNCVVLFDEIEKAHQKVLDILLQILDTGSIKTAQGMDLSFRNTVVFLTSNLGAMPAKSLGFNSETSSKPQNQIPSEVRQALSLELLNRLDGILQFNMLSKEVCGTLAQRYLSELATNVMAHNIQLHWNSDMVSILVDNYSSKEFGARELKRGIEKEIGGYVTNLILSESNIMGVVQLSYEAGKLRHVLLNSEEEQA